MKTIRAAIFAFSIMAASACNNQHLKIQDASLFTKGNRTVEKTIISKIDKAGQIDLNSFEYIVTEMLTTSPRFKQLTKGLYKQAVLNGGLSYGICLEGSPNPTQSKAWSYSRTYDFRLVEMVSDKQQNTAHFSFNPHNRQLYEYDEIHNQLKQLRYDRNLLLKYDALSK